MQIIRGLPVKTTLVIHVRIWLHVYHQSGANQGPPLIRYAILRLHLRRECRESFPRHRLQKKTQDNDPVMHHGTCFTHERVDQYRMKFTAKPPGLHSEHNSPISIYAIYPQSTVDRGIINSYTGLSNFTFNYLNEGHIIYDSLMDHHSLLADNQFFPDRLGCKHVDHRNDILKKKRTFLLFCSMDHNCEELHPLSVIFVSNIGAIQYVFRNGPLSQYIRQCFNTMPKIPNLWLGICVPDISIKTVSFVTFYQQAVLRLRPFKI